MKNCYKLKNLPLHKYFSGAKMELLGIFLIWFIASASSQMLIPLECNREVFNQAKTFDLRTIEGESQALEFFKRVAFGSQKSVIISPHGIWNALSLAYLGSRGETQKQLGFLLALSSNQFKAQQQINEINSR